MSLTIHQILVSLMEGVKVASKIDPELDAIYQEYQVDLTSQNTIGWPQIILRCEQELISIYKYSSGFIRSSNPLFLIHKLIHIEQRKLPGLKERDWPSVLDRKVIDIDLTTCTINDLVRHVKTALAKYMSIYDEGREYNIASDILANL